MISDVNHVVLKIYDVNLNFVFQENYNSEGRIILLRVYEKIALILIRSFGAESILVLRRS